MPDLLIIGAQKAGTTSLHRYLCRHPNVLGPWSKEVHYFDIQYDKGTTWYRTHFPSWPYKCLKDIRRGRRSLAFETSPYYLFHPCVPERVHKLLPNVKLIAILRDPVGRAYSHYHHELRLGYETLPLEEALAKEEERLAGEADKIRNTPGYESLN
ncbi:MAG: sulfotransferase domain-containing protein, partial [Planctomycetes bacterium]|nr:sulfotransferase domain-containing protein [Planctomycetota bacterium]